MDGWIYLKSLGKSTFGKIPVDVIFLQNPLDTVCWIGVTWTKPSWYNSYWTKFSWDIIPGAWNFAQAWRMAPCARLSSNCL